MTETLPCGGGGGRPWEKLSFSVTPLRWQRRLQIEKTAKKSSEGEVGFFVGSSDLLLQEKKQQHSRWTVSSEQPVGTCIQQRAFSNVRARQGRRITSKHVGILLREIIIHVISPPTVMCIRPPKRMSHSLGWLLSLPSCSAQLFLPCFIDGMTDQGNRLSYILINPSPDTRLELHDVV